MDRDSFFNDLRSFREEWNVYIAEEGIEKTRRNFRNFLAWGVHNDVIKENEVTEYPDGGLIDGGKTIDPNTETQKIEKTMKQVTLILKAPLDSEDKEYYDIKIHGPAGEEIDFDIIEEQDVSAD